MNQIQTNRYTSIQQMTEQLKEAAPKKELTSESELPKLSFREILEQRTKQNELIFSKHASQRLVSRNIQLSDMQKERLNDGVERAFQKGIKDSLVMMDNLAFIVNVPNKTVITAVGEGDEKIFTNIDGAIIV